MALAMMRALIATIVRELNAIDAAGLIHKTVRDTALEPAKVQTSRTIFSITDFNEHFMLKRREAWGMG